MGDAQENHTPLLIDANIFLEVIFKRRHHESCRQLLSRTMNGEIRALVPLFSVHGIEAYLSRRGHHDKVLAFLSVLERSQGITIFNSTIRDEQRAIEFTTPFSLDFDDALHYYAAKSGVFFNATIVSFDTDFDRTDITRLEPQDLLTSM